MKNKDNLMKAKILLLFAMAFSAGTANAAWLEVSERVKTSVSIDTETIRRTGNEAKIWTLYNYKAPERLLNGKRFLSTKVLEVVNCREQTSYSASSEDYTGAYGQGDTISSANFIAYQDEVPVVPGSISDDIAKHACGDVMADRDRRDRRDPIDSPDPFALPPLESAAETDYRKGIADELVASLVAFHRWIAFTVLL